MRDALHAAGRPMVFSICEWGDNKPWEWAGDVGNLWRTTGDIYHCFDCKIDHGTWYSWGVLQILDHAGRTAEVRRPRALERSRHAGSRQWHDVNEDRAHFSMWCMLAAPLISGNDLRHMSKETSEILMNKEVIAVDQDRLGIEGFRYSSETASWKSGSSRWRTEPGRCACSTAAPGRKRSHSTGTRKKWLMISQNGKLSLTRRLIVSRPVDEKRPGHHKRNFERRGAGA